MPQDLTGQRYPDFSLDDTIYPDKVRDSPWGRLAPLIDAATLRQEYMFGIPMWSFFPNPVTGKRDQMTDHTLGRIIERSVVRVEELSGCLIAPSYCVENYPFDLAEYRSFGFLKLSKRPYTSLVHVKIAAADGSKLMDLPLQWIGVAHLVKGQLFVQPHGTMGAVSVSVSGTPPFLLYLGQHGFVPQFWQIEGVAGFQDMMMPAFVNDLIAVTAAMEALSQLGATYAFMTGGSLSIDALSQSSSGPGPGVFSGRVGELRDTQQTLLKKLKKFCGLSLVSGSV